MATEAVVVIPFLCEKCGEERMTSIELDETICFECRAKRSLPPIPSNLLPPETVPLRTVRVRYKRQPGGYVPEPTPEWERMIRLMEDGLNELEPMNG